MAKRKARAGKPAKKSRRKTPSARKPPSPQGARAKTRRSRAKGRTRGKMGRPATPRKTAKPKARVRKKAVRKAAVRKTAIRKTATRKAAVRKTSRKSPARRTPTAAAPRRTRTSKPPTPVTHETPARLSRERRTLDDTSSVASPPSSLDMNPHASSARTGSEEMREHRADHATMTPSIVAGDLDVSVEDAYFTGDETPGGDNSTPDQDVVDDIGRALGVEYADNEQLQSSNKLVERDKHRWELDPASAEDFTSRDKE